MTKKISQSQILRNSLYKVYEWLSSEYRENTSFDSFYEKEMIIIINDIKQKI